MRVLLCDRHRLWVEALAASLCHRGHDIVAMTTTPEEAFAAAVEQEPDVCLVDVAFPAGHGIDMVTKIRATTRSKVLVLSAQCDTVAVRAALVAGAGGFVGKDQGLNDVLHALDELWEGKVTVRVKTASVPRRGPGRPRPPELAPLRYLTSREREALRLIAEGQSTKQIARSMGVAYSTARTHVQNALAKLGVRSQLEAAALVARAGWVEQLDDGIAVAGQVCPVVPPAIGPVRDAVRRQTPTSARSRLPREGRWRRPDALCPPGL